MHYKSKIYIHIIKIRCLLDLYSRVYQAIQHLTTSSIESHHQSHFKQPISDEPIPVQLFLIGSSRHDEECYQLMVRIQNYERSHKFSIFSLLCNVLWIIFCLFVIFLLVIELSFLQQFTAFDLISSDFSDVKNAVLTCCCLHLTVK